MNKYAMSQFDAFEVTVEMKGEVQEYAMNFLAIFNNVKTYHDLIRVTNDSGNKVMVVCEEDVLERVKDYLRLFGTITSVELVSCLRLEEDPPYDYEKYQDLVIVPFID